MRPSLYVVLTPELVHALDFSHWPLAPAQLDAKGALMTEPTPIHIKEWVIHDTPTRDLSGLAVRVTRGSKSWIVRRKRPKGGESWRSVLGPTGKLTVNKARAKAKEWFAFILREGKNPDHVAKAKAAADKEIRKSLDYTFGDAYLDFVKDGEERVKLRTLRPKSLPDRQAPVNWLKGTTLWQVPVAELNDGHAKAAFAQWFADAEGARIAADRGDAWPKSEGLPHDLASAHKALSYSKATWNFAKCRKVAINPFSAWVKSHGKLPKVRRRQEVLPADTDAGVLWLKELEALRSSKDPIQALLADYVMVALLFGGRKSELAELRWKDVNHEQAFACFAAETTKGNADHFIPLTVWSDSILRDRFKKNRKAEWPTEPTSLVFPYPHTKDGRIADYRPITRLLKEKTGLWIRLHDLRRTLATSVFGSAKDLGTVAVALGHATGKEVTRDYIPLQHRLAALRELYTARDKRMRLAIGLDQLAVSTHTPAQLAILSAMRLMLKNAGLTQLSAADLGGLLLAEEET